MRACPLCQSKSIHRSRTRGWFENRRKDLTGKRPHRCHACGWRGWGAESGPKFNEAELKLALKSLAPSPPNLKGTMLAPRARDFASLELERLDVPLEASDQKK